VKQWKNNDTTYQNEMNKAVKQGMMRLYDVSAMQPLVLWEVQCLRESRGKRKQHLPVRGCSVF
jgi:hypothetical protein